MTGSVSEGLLDAISSWISAHAGLYFPQDRWKDLNRGIAAAARELEFPDAESYAHHLLSSAPTKGQIEGIARHLTVGETYFFRDHATMTALESHVLPKLIRARQQTGRALRIWSAGCCTGEEPYTIAMMLQQILPDWRSWDLTIAASDINSAFLHRARRGIYRGWSFRDALPEIQRTFFTSPQKDHFEIRPEIRSMVKFDYLNLAEDAPHPPFPGPFDIIFCRNVLMYFSPEKAKQVLHRFHRSLVTDGWMIVSPSEASRERMEEFIAVEFPGAIFYSKTDAARHTVASPLQSCPQSETRNDSSFAPVASLFPAHRIPAAAPPKRMRPVEEHVQDSFEQGDYPHAAEILLTVIARRPANGYALTMLARIRANQGALAEAREWGERAVAADRLNPRAHYLLGTIQQEAGLWAAAVASLQRTLYLDQDFVLAHFSLGNLARRQGKLKQSIKHFENTLRTLKKLPPAIPIPESDGITPQQLADVIQLTILPALILRGDE